MLNISEKHFDIIFNVFWKNVEKNEFGGRFIHIGLENVAVAAARVVELPLRCSNKVVKKRRCL